MLYQDKSLGRFSFWRRLRLRLRFPKRGRSLADLDILSMSGHLQRDLGIAEGQSGFVAHRLWPK